jgi:hypothetical protein
VGLVALEVFLAARQEGLALRLAETREVEIALELQKGWEKDTLE